LSVKSKKEYERKKEGKYLVNTIAGSGLRGHKDGVGKDAEFCLPFGIALSKDKKHLFVVDSENHCIRKISLDDGATSTVAGVPGMSSINPI
jgi:sugar lactone lactonase YvrE